jgi:hypothetical protein
VTDQPEAGGPAGGTEPPAGGTGPPAGRAAHAGRRRAVIAWEVRPKFRFAFVVVIALMLLSILACVLIGFTVGGYALAATLTVAALFRLTLAPEYCLGLIVRSRRTDVITCLVLAVSLAFLAGSVPGF